MTSDLFPDCKQDSPRLAWMKRHGVFAYHDERGYYVSLYDAKPSSRTSFFETEDEALASWAAGRGIPPWNEEPIKRKAWMQRHNIMLGYNCGADEWCAQVCIAGTWGMDAHHTDRDGALHNLAVKLGIKDWNDEQLAKENGK